jgi:hypothetical protein
MSAIVFAPFFGVCRGVEKLFSSEPNVRCEITHAQYLRATGRFKTEANHAGLPRHN